MLYQNQNLLPSPKAHTLAVDEILALDRLP